MGKIKVEAYVSLGYVGADKHKTFEYDEKDFEGMTEDDRKDHIESDVEFWKDEVVAWGWEIKNEQVD